MKKSNLKAIKLLVLPLCLSTIMFLTLNQSIGLYIIGQLCGVVFFAQCFILMHEFGHNSLFKHKSLNIFMGHITSLFTFIPYYNWQEIHELHHKWTGYRDKDPTTEKTFDDRLSRFQRNLINFCWKYYIPIFTIGYRFGIYWKSEKLKRHLPRLNYNRCLVSMFIYLTIYVSIIVLYPDFVLKLLPAIILSFNITDIISLSQHSHIQMNNSNGQVVEPLKYVDQVTFSRSLILPKFISQYFLFNMNYHEAHHAYPGLPCYHLDQISVKGNNAYLFGSWIRKVKKIKGVDFIFKSDPNRAGF